MSGRSLPKVRVSKVFPVSTPPTGDVLEFLIKNGFVFDVVSAPSSNGAPVTAKKVRRRRRRTPLTAERISEFRKARQAGKSYRRIGKIFGVSDARAWQIVNKGV